MESGVSAVLTAEIAGKTVAVVTKSYNRHSTQKITGIALQKPLECGIVYTSEKKQNIPKCFFRNLQLLGGKENEKDNMCADASLHNTADCLWKRRNEEQGTQSFSKAD